MPDAPARLADRQPQVPTERLVAQLVPPPRFDDVRFATYRPDPDEPSQATAKEELERFAERVAAPPPNRGLFGKRGIFGRRKEPEGPPGVYLDGGFGVGKTHLLASLWHAVSGPKAYGTFVEYTQLVGALGFEGTVRALAEHRLLCIDEFELDDPGDTVLVSTLLQRLVDEGVAVAATSNTLPGELGEGRFASDDFLREIQGLSSHFATLRVEGEDYRHRGQPEPPPPPSEDDVRAVAERTDGATLDDFDALVAHLEQLHPSRYGALLDDVTAVCLTGVRTVHDQTVALRLVVLADRAYDRALPVHAAGVPLDRLFGEEMLAGGYRKKYLRATSRLTALARSADEDAAAAG